MYRNFIAITLITKYNTWMANKALSNTETIVKRRPGRPKESFVDNTAKAKAFGFKLKRFRVSNNLTQEQMGKFMRINGDAVPSKIVIARWEAGKHAPQKRYVDKLENLVKKKRNQDENEIHCSEVHSIAES